jgi:hypothetical protein
VYAGWALVFPSASVRRLLLLALATSLAVELSQLCQAPWLREIRRTTAGHLVLGSTYSSADLAAYAVGGAAAALVDALRVLASRAAGLQRDEPGGDRGGWGAAASKEAERSTLNIERSTFNAATGSRPGQDFSATSICTSTAELTGRPATPTAAPKPAA